MESPTKLVLRPSLRLYPTPTGVVLFDRDPYGIEVRHVTKPALALTLALFDGQRTVAEVANVISRIFDMDVNEVGHKLVSIVNTYVHEGLLVDVNQINHKWAVLKPSAPELSDLLKYNVGKVSLSRPRAPYSIVYIVTHRCNKRCIYCYANASPDVPKEEWLPVQRLETLFKEMGQLGVAMINFSGGEPFVRKNFPDLALMALDHGIFPWISTKERVANQVAFRLARAGLPLIQISIDSLDHEVQDYLCNKKGALDDLLATLNAFLEADVDVCTHTVLTSVNIQGVPRLVEFLLSRGVRTCVLSPYVRSLGRHSHDLFASDKQWAALFRWYETECDRTRVQLRYASAVRQSLNSQPSGDEWNPSGCTGGREGLAILPDGKVALCERLAYYPDGLIGSVRDHSLQEMWSSNKMLRMVYPPQELFAGTPCEQCPEYERCIRDGMRCYVRAVLAYGRLFAPDPLCPRAPRHPGRFF
ncbi:MAG: radical SAM protein [Anaerolineae bacterium]|jgi:radical SAM protein with 4Fe4S-binding SPASM domain|nr:radical SAM protein [Anaerolineae bacterium]